MFQSHATVVRAVGRYLESKGLLRSSVDSVKLEALVDPTCIRVFHEKKKCAVGKMPGQELVPGDPKRWSRKIILSFVIRN